MIFKYHNGILRIILNVHGHPGTKRSSLHITEQNVAGRHPET